MKRLAAFAVMMALATAPPARAEQFSMTAEPPVRLAPKDIRSAVEGLAEAMATGYVDSLAGGRVREKLLASLKAGVYRPLTEPRRLVERLVGDVQEIIHDGHFNLVYSPPDATGFKWVNASDGPDDPAARLEEDRQRMRGQNFGVTEARVLQGNVGYVNLSSFNAPQALAREPLAHAFGLVANTDALILDVRRNPGGQLDYVQLAVSYFCDGPPVLLSTIHRKMEQPPKEEFWTLTDPGGAKYLGRPVFVLTSAQSASGAEDFAYQMQNRKKAVVVGERTPGAAHSFIPVQVASPAGGKLIALLPNAYIVDGLTGGDWEGAGVTPDVACPAGDALDEAHRLAVKRLMAAATDEAARAGYASLLSKLEFVARGSAATPTDLAKYVGQYGIRRVFLEDGLLRFQREGGPRVDLEMVGPDEFELQISMTPRPRIRFEVRDGAADAMFMNTPGGEQRIEKGESAAGAAGGKP